MPPKKVKRKKSKKHSKKSRRRRNSSSSSQSETGVHEQAWNYDLEHWLTTADLHNPNMIISGLSPKALSKSFFAETGMHKPIHFESPDGLGMKIPPPHFSVDNVKRCVGPKRMVEVVNVSSQQSDFMSMNKFCEYFKSPRSEKKELFNVLSLEYSKTKLENKVRAPWIVRQMDWVEQMWPKELKMRQKSSTNDMKHMYYPKVQNYCLMSVKGCFTDFHVDFGGTSVWYHLVKGEKTFWLVEPTEPNLHQFEEWLLSGHHQNNVFFASLVRTHRVTLKAGNVFFIPSGWIHAVFTPEDSLVFGGNFLHQYAMPMQIRVYKTEDNTHVRQKFRYPYYLEMHWYVLNYYSVKFTEKDYIKQVEIEEDESVPPQVESQNDTSLEFPEGSSVLPMPPSVPTTHPPLIASHVSEPLNGEGFLIPFHHDDPNVEYCRPTKWNEAFLQKLSSLEIEGLQKVTDWMAELIACHKQKYPRGLVYPKTLLADIRAGVAEAQRLKKGRMGLFEICQPVATGARNSVTDMQRQIDIEATISSVCKGVNKVDADSTTSDEKPSTSFASDHTRIFDAIPLGKHPLPSFLRKHESYRPLSHTKTDRLWRSQIPRKDVVPTRVPNCDIRHRHVKEEVHVPPVKHEDIRDTERRRFIDHRRHGHEHNHRQSHPPPHVEGGSWRPPPRVPHPHYYNRHSPGDRLMQPRLRHPHYQRPEYHRERYEPHPPRAPPNMYPSMRELYDRRSDREHYAYTTQPAYQQSTHYYDHHDQYSTRPIAAQHRETAQRIGEQMNRILEEDRHSQFTGQRQECGFVPPSAPGPHTGPHTGRVPPSDRYDHACGPLPPMSTLAPPLSKPAPLSPRRAGLLLSPGQKVLYEGTWNDVSPSTNPPATPATPATPPNPANPPLYPRHKPEIDSLKCITPLVEYDKCSGVDNSGNPGEVRKRHCNSPRLEPTSKKPMLAALIKDVVPTKQTDEALSQMASALDSLISIIPSTTTNDDHANIGQNVNQKVEQGIDGRNDQVPIVKDEIADMKWLDTLGGLTQQLTALK